MDDVRNVWGHCLFKYYHRIVVSKRNSVKPSRSTCTHYQQMTKFAVVLLIGKRKGPVQGPIREAFAIHNNLLERKTSDAESHMAFCGTVHGVLA